jgi:hypothetical protein
MMTTPPCANVLATAAPPHLSLKSSPAPILPTPVPIAITLPNPTSLRRSMQQLLRSARRSIPVQEDECRTSFTQFSPDGIFRYVDSSFWTDKRLAEDDPAEHKCLAELKEKWWEEGLALYSTMDELLHN